MGRCERCAAICEEMPVRNGPEVIQQMEDCGCCVGNIRAVRKLMRYAEEARDKVAVLSQTLAAKGAKT